MRSSVLIRKISCPADSIKAGLVLAPEDRKKDGLCTRLSIADNIALPNLDILCEGPVGTVNRKKEKAMVDNAVKALKIKLPNAQVDAGSLSGGNQQKVVVAKWLEIQELLSLMSLPEVLM